MTLAARSTRGAVFLIASTIINIAVGFLGGIVLARLLTPNDFGTFTLATTLSAFADIRGKLQLDQKFLRDHDARPEYADTFFTVSLGLGGLSFLALCLAALGAFAFSRLDLAICLSVIGLLSLLEPLSLTLRLALEKQVTFERIALIQSAVSLTQFAITLVAALAGFGLWSLLGGFSVGVLLNLGLFLKSVPHRPALRLNQPLAREFLAYGLKYGLVYAISGIVLTQGDNLIVGLVAGTAALGFYDRAYRTSSWPTLLLSAALGRIALPAFSELQDDPARLRQAFGLVLWTVLSLTTPLALILLVTAPELVPTLYGEKWLPSVPILQWLAAFAITRPLWDNMVAILIATGRPGQMARLVFIQAAALIALAVPLTFLYSGTGTAISVGLAFAIAAGFLLYFAHTCLQIDLLETAGLPLLNNLIALAVFLALRPTLPLEQLSPLLRLGVESVALLAAYVLVSLMTSRQIISSRARYFIRVTRG